MLVHTLDKAGNEWGAKAHDGGGGTPSLALVRVLEPQQRGAHAHCTQFILRKLLQKPGALLILGLVGFFLNTFPGG